MADTLVTLLTDLLGKRFVDLRAELPKACDFRVVSSAAMPYIAVHHTVSAYTSTWKNIAQFHIDIRGFCAIGYHFGIQYGVVSYLGSVDTQRAHVRLRNHEALGICIMGDYSNAKPKPEDLAALHTLIYGLDLYYPSKKRIVGHRDLMTPGYTECPGNTFYQLIAPLNVRLRDTLLLEADKHQRIQLNPDAALQKAIRSAGPSSWQITSDEFGVSYGGAAYVGQRAEHVVSGAVRVYYTPMGRWGDWSYVTR